MNKDNVLYKKEKIKKILLFFIIGILAFIVRLPFLKYKTEDYIVYLEKWFYIIKGNGGIFALKYNIGDYNCPYIQILSLLTYLPINPLVSIKSVSIVFDNILAISASILVSKIVKSNKSKFMIITYGIILFLPTVIINSAYWSQCDVIYTTFVIISLIKLIDKKYFLSVCFLGIAFAFKLQFIFILPAYIIMFLSDKEISKKIYYFIVIPIINFIICLPSIIIGRNIKDVITIYFSQAKEYNSAITSNIPNIYNLVCEVGQNKYIVRNYNQYLPKVMILIVLVLFLVFMILFIRNKIKIKEEQIVLLSLWSVMICTFLLPYMHDRYMFMADIISVLFFVISIANKEEKFKRYLKISLALFIQVSSLYSYIAYISKYRWNLIDNRIISFINFIIVIYLTYEVVNLIINNIKKRNLNGENKTK